MDNVKLQIRTFILSFDKCSLLPDPDYPKEGYLNYMPEETQIGANTFGCYINGKLVAVQGKYKQEGVKLGSLLWGFGSVNGFWNKQDTIMKVHCFTKNDDISFYFENLCLGINECGVKYYRSDPFLTDYVEGININITKLDTVEQIVCARFDTIIIPMERFDTTLVLTHGQFDVKYGKDY